MNNINKKLCSLILGGSVVAGTVMGWWCNNCHRNHNGPYCPQRTMFECGFNPCDVDSDDEDELIQNMMEQRRIHHNQHIQQIRESFRSIRNQEDAQQVLESFNQRMDQLGFPRAQMRGVFPRRRNSDRFGCGGHLGGNNWDHQPFGCHDDYGYHGGYEPFGCAW